MMYVIKQDALRQFRWLIPPQPFRGWRLYDERYPDTPLCDLMSFNRVGRYIEIESSMPMMLSNAKTFPPMCGVGELFKFRYRLPAKMVKLDG